MAPDATDLGETCACNIQHDQQDTGTAAEHLLRVMPLCSYLAGLCFGGVLCICIFIQERNF